MFPYSKFCETEWGLLKAKYGRDLHGKREVERNAYKNAIIQPKVQRSVKVGLRSFAGANAADYCFLSVQGV
ncbi:MAG: hypothetical protein QOF62_199 [Pyrinomonadaceae bacterium]|jgi:hypothetical protein|nr:hypothetical protein [Pyrinomonadaceae bacterium]